MLKVEEIQNYLQQNQIDAAFVTTPDNVFTFQALKVIRMRDYLA